MTHEAKPQSKLGRDLVPGDRIVTEDGREVRITNVSRGMIFGTLLVRWREGWAHVWPRERVEVRNA